MLCSQGNEQRNNLKSILQVERERKANGNTTPWAQIDGTRTRAHRRRRRQTIACLY